MSAQGKHGGLTQISRIINNKQNSARHLRRKAEKLAKKYPTEVNHVLAQLERKHDK